MSRRVDYDAVAQVYDRPWYREKIFDPLLREFLSTRALGRRARILDVGCGTGAQLAANRRETPDLLYVGADTSIEMLRLAHARDRRIHWLRTDGAAMPFSDGSFDYASNQFALHHIDRKRDFLAEVARVLRKDGRMAIRNLDPWSMKNWVLYRYFPGALESDLDDFMPIEAITSALDSMGLSNIRVDRRHRDEPVRLGEFASDVRFREGRSQLLALRDSDYDSGLGRVEADLDHLGAEASLVSEKCDVTITADKP